MLSRIGRFFRRLGGDRNRPSTTEQDEPAEEASRQQAEGDPFARDVIGRTRPLTVSERSIHQARSVAVTDTRPIVSPARPQERRDISTEALPFATPREALPPVGSIPSDAEGPVGTTFEGDSTGDSEWDALWHLRGSSREPAQPAVPMPAPPRTDRPSSASDTPAPPVSPAQGSVQRAPESGATASESTPGTEPEPFAQDEPQPEVRRTTAAPAARQPVPRPVASIEPTEGIQRRPSLETTSQVPDESEPVTAQQRELETEPPEVEARATELRPEKAEPSVPSAPVQRSSSPVESAAALPPFASVQRDIDELHPPLSAHPAEEDRPQLEPDGSAMLPESAAPPQRQAAPESPAPVRPAIQRQVASTRKEPNVPDRAPEALPPDVGLQPEAATSALPASVQPKPTEPGPVSPSHASVQGRPIQEAPASEPLADIGVETVPSEDTSPQPEATPAVPAAPLESRTPAPRAPEPGPRPVRVPAQESKRPEDVSQPEPQVPVPVPPASRGIQREIEPAVTPTSAPEPVVRPEPASLPPAAVTPPPPTRARTVQRREGIEPTMAQPGHRAPEPAAPPAPGLPEAAGTVSEVAEVFETEPDLVQQRVDRREALRQALQPRIVPTVVQRAVEEGTTEQTSSSATEPGSETEEEQGPNIEALAKDVYRLLKKRLLVERERDLGRI